MGDLVFSLVSAVSADEKTNKPRGDKMTKKYKIGDKVTCGSNGEYMGYIKELGTPKRWMYMVELDKPIWHYGKYTFLYTCHEWELKKATQCQ